MVPDIEVLILILLEYGLRHRSTNLYGLIRYGLNPYSIGIWSATLLSNCKHHHTSLNPYSIGIWSATYLTFLSKNIN